MIRERRYRGGSRSRSPPHRRPPPRSRDVKSPRHWKLSPYRRRGTEYYPGEAKTSRRIEKKDNFDDRVPRFSACEDRDIDRFGGRRFGSPQRIEERVDFGRPVSLSDYGDGAKGKYENEGSVGGLRRTYDVSYRGDLSSMKLKWDHPLDGSRESDYLSMKKYNPTRIEVGSSGDIDVSSSGDRDYHLQNHYLDSSQAGLPVSRYLDSTKPVSFKYESGGKLQSQSYSLARGRIDDMPISNLSAGDGSSRMPYVASQYLNSDADKERYFRYRDDPHLKKKDGLHDREDNYFDKKSGGIHLLEDRYLGVGKSLENEIYKFKKEDNLLSSKGYLKSDSDYMVSSSHHKDYNPEPSGILREGISGYSSSRELHMPSLDVIQRGSGLSSQPIRYDGYSEKKHNMLPTEPGGLFDDARSRSHLYVGLPEERREDWSYTEFGRSKIDGISTRLNKVEEDYKEKHILRTDVLKHAVDDCSHKEHIEDDGLCDQYPFQVQSAPDKFDLRGSLHVRREDEDMLGTGSTHLNYVSQGCYAYGDVKREKHRADIDGGQWSHLKNLDPLQSREYDSTFDRFYNSPRKRLPMADLSLVEPYDRRLGGKHVGDDMLYDHDVDIRISADGNGARRIYNQVDLEDEIDLVHFSKKHNSSRLDYEKTWRFSSELGSDEPSSSVFYPHHSIKLHKSDSRDIKKRLGPIQKLHVSQRLMKKYKPSIKKRLAPAPSKKHATLPWIKNNRSSKMMSDQNDPDEGVRDHDEVCLGDHLPVEKPEPPEKSEEFKQLVQSAFFKYLKQMNETPIKRKKYTERGNAGILKCFVCGSNSEEFAGTKSLAMHAFTSKTVGLRSQHLGLHEALCVLMGWKITKHPSSEWQCEVITDAETQVLKEDLIIWPPVVIVHNCTIDSMSPGDRVIISAEKLDTKLRDMGFGSILKVCNGKPSNQSVLLVKFNGTLSGLQEAERFHQSYVEAKHGRAEFKQLKTESGSSRGGAKAKSSRSEDNILYGYLGIAEDLDKLDFATKKRCVLRSKTKILRIVDAPIVTDGYTG